MTRVLRLLDLFCCAGGCSAGYTAAGFTCYGVDNRLAPLRRYPYPAVLADAMAVLAGRVLDLSVFDVIHASPPCQAYSITRHTHHREHPDLLPWVLDALEDWGGVWVVENVPGAPMPPDLTITVCGAHRRAYDPHSGRTLRLRRHRLFASNVPLMAHPCGCDSVQTGGVYSGGSVTPTAAKIRGGGYTPPTAVRRELMGIDWMTQDQLSQAIPPDYTADIGRQLVDHLTRSVA